MDRTNKDLIEAAEAGNYSAIQALILHPDCNANFADSNGATPLMHAALHLSTSPAPASKPRSLRV